MKVGIDIRPYLLDKSGMGQYVYQLALHLLLNDKNNTYVLFADRDFNLPEFPPFEKIVYKSPLHLGKKVNAIFFHIKLIFSVKKLVNQYISTSALYVTAFHPGFGIITVHDLVAFKFPYLHTLKTKFFIRAFLGLAARNAKSIVTVSENTKKDLLELFPYVNANKVFAIPLGVDEHLLKIDLQYTESTWKQVCDTFHITKPFVLFVGSIEPRKNLLTLIKAFEIVHKQNAHVQLVLAGKQGWGTTEIHTYLETIEEHIRNDIIMTGFITEEQKAYLYKKAKILVYPSLYEGFGMPLLEAMLMDLPFITSNTSSLPEVAGEAGILVNPENKEMLAEKISYLIENEDVCNQLIKKGKAQVQKFNWNATASRYIEILSL